MIFGYVAAVITGFVMTAIPNWTGRMPVMGMPLFLFFLLWLAGRGAMFIGGNGLLVAGIDSLFLVAVAGFVWREVTVREKLAQSSRLYHHIAASRLPTFCITPALRLIYHINSGCEWRLALIAMLMMFIGGRVIPSFTTNWMKKQGLAILPAPFGFFDKARIIGCCNQLAGLDVFARQQGSCGLLPGCSAPAFHPTRQMAGMARRKGRAGFDPAYCLRMDTGRVCSHRVSDIAA